MARSEKSLAAAFIGAAIFAGAEAHAFDKIEKSSGKMLAQFSSVYIAPVALDLDLDVRRFDRGGVGDRPINETDQNRKAADLYEDLTTAFAKSFKLADGPGEHVLTIKTTLTDLASTRPTQADFQQRTSLSLSSVYAGGGAVEIELMENGASIATISDHNFGSFNDGQPRIGVWQDADEAFQRWSRKLVKYVKKN